MSQVAEPILGSGGAFDGQGAGCHQPLLGGMTGRN
jgi:hypothetical protein